MTVAPHPGGGAADRGDELERGTEEVRQKAMAHQLLDSDGVAAAFKQTRRVGVAEFVGRCVRDFGGDELLGTQKCLQRRSPRSGHI
jgi:hypothetical protein